ncbi:undecaprenyl-diphosphatase, partial [Staphylococcus aureus]|nr:undecaprenyl-diphosphatase [Staphylococcus aureus]
LAESVLYLLKHYQDIHIADIPFYILVFLAAFTVVLIAIKTFLHLINKIKLIPFAFYSIILVIFIARLYFGFGFGKC